MDTIALKLPRDRAYLPLLHMILGGIALRKDLCLDALDDIQLAVDSLLAEDEGRERNLTITVEVRDDALCVRLDHLSGWKLKDTLARGQIAFGGEAVCIDICILLNSLVDSYQVLDLEEGFFAVEMQKFVR